MRDSLCIQGASRGTLTGSEQGSSKSGKQNVGMIMARMVWGQPHRGTQRRGRKDDTIYIAFVRKLWSTRTGKPTRANLSHYENMRHPTLFKVQALRDLSKFFHCLHFPLHITALRRLDVDSSLFHFATPVSSLLPHRHSFSPSPVPNVSSFLLPYFP